MLPDSYHIMQDKSHSGVKKSKEILNVIFCANMYRTSKSPLLVIGKSVDSRCFCGCKNFPLSCSKNSSACMEGDIFEKWKNTWDRQLLMKHNIVFYCWQLIGSSAGSWDVVHWNSASYTQCRQPFPNLWTGDYPCLEITLFKIFHQESGERHWFHSLHLWKLNCKTILCSGLHEFTCCGVVQRIR